MEASLIYKWFFILFKDEVETLGRKRSLLRGKSCVAEDNLPCKLQPLTTEESMLRRLLISAKLAMFYVMENERGLNLHTITRFKIKTSIFFFSLCILHLCFRTLS